MVSISDTHSGYHAHQEFDQAKVLREKLQASSGVNRGGRMFFGSVLVLSALGLWLVPVDTGDAAMQLIKMLISLVMLALGAMFILSLNAGETLPEIQIDGRKRELRVIKRDAANASYVETCLSFDALSEVTLRDRLLTARDDSGRLVATVPVQDKATEKALQEALQGMV